MVAWHHRAVTRVMWLADQVRETIESQATVWLRAAAALDNQDAWSLRFLEIVVRRAPPSWQPIRWEYETAVFVSAQLPGPEVASWLASGSVPLGDRKLPLRVVGQARATRSESNARHETYETLLWPCLSIELGAAPTGSIGQETLVSENAPAFYDFGTAAAAFLGRPAAPGLARLGAPPVLRYQDDAGRISSVRLSISELAVDIEGDRLEGVIVELGHPEGSFRQRLDADRAATVRFALRTELPRGSWIVLHRDGEWIDRRSLNPPYTRAVELRSQLPIEHEARLHALVLSGEGIHARFERSLPPLGDTSSLREALKTAAAFANGDGGSILFGVASDGRIEGIDLAAQAEARLTNLINAWIWPQPSWQIRVLPVGESNAVYELAVGAGDWPPYGCGTEPGNLIYYTRRGATTFAVTPEELRALALRASSKWQGP